MAKTFGANRVLEYVDLGVAPGESVAVVGRSGSGKSTLLRIAALFEPADSGTVQIRGRRATGASERTRSRLRATSIGYVFQEARLLDNVSVHANLRVAHSFGPPVSRSDARMIEPLMERTGIAHLRNRRAGRLSGGERQRVAICRALARSPAVVLADEPTSALDDETASDVLDLLFHIKESGTALLVVTHDPLVAGRADRVLRLSGGVLRVPP